MNKLQEAALRQLLGVVTDRVTNEVVEAIQKFPPMNSAHEGYAVILEELDELWKEVRAKQGSRNLSALRKEAIQVAAMAVRFVHDICNAEKHNV